MSQADPVQRFGALIALALPHTLRPLIERLSMRALSPWFAGILLGALSSSGCQTAPLPTADRGKHQFDNYCLPCHGADGQGKPEIAAPSIAGLPVWYIEGQLQKYRTGLRGSHFDDLEGMRMRPMSLTLGSSADVTAVATYASKLRSIQPPTSQGMGGDAAKGAPLFAACATCHGSDGKGMEEKQAPPLTEQYDWYLVRQLQKFKDGVRGYDEEQGSNAYQMQAVWAQTLADEQAMKDVVAHIQTLRK